MSENVEIVLQSGITVTVKSPATNPDDLTKYISSLQMSDGWVDFLLSKEQKTLRVRGSQIVGFYYDTEPEEVERIGG